MQQEKIRSLVAALTLEEKAGLTSGQDNWFTKAIERLNIPAVRVSDGPSGLRTQAGDVGALDDSQTQPSVCYPGSCLTAASFDRDLLIRLGEALGQDAQALDVNVLLAPGVNIKRSPLCGRNFEYFSEDPYLSGQLGAAYVKGVQSQGVGASLKHFFANSQEYRRMDSSSEMDERTMREIYLPAFETVVKDAHPRTVMASYNKIDGVYATESKQYLTDLLRGEWGYTGLVVSDWGAVHDRVRAIMAGCDLTMPAEDSDQEIVNAVRTGRLSEDALNECCERIIELALDSLESSTTGTALDYDDHHRLAREIAVDSMVLLKNDGLLPITDLTDIAFIGLFAKAPRIQGGGSSHVRSAKVVSAMDAAKNMSFPVRYAPGYKEDGSTDEDLLKEAVLLAKESRAVVLFIGLPDSMESEGVDRTHMQMPEGHNALVSAVCAANPNAVVVLHNGSPVEMPWVNAPRAILEAYLAGEVAGEAVLDVLTGTVNPSGRLPESFPIKLEDNPSYLSFGGEGNRARYQEGIFVGYRYYTSKKQEVLFPFGHGLSYTSFAYNQITLDKASMDENDTLKVTVTVSNTGDRVGKLVVQLYVAPQKVDIIRPVRELRKFTKVELQPGEIKDLTFTLNRRDFAHWNDGVHDWRCEKGTYSIQIGKNAHEVTLSADLELNAQPLAPVGGYCIGMPMQLMVVHPQGKSFLDENIIHLVRGMAMMGYIPKEMLTVVDSIPGGLTLDAMEALTKQSDRSGAGGANGISALLIQAVSILDSFLPAEKKTELRALLDTMNKAQI